MNSFLGKMYEFSVHFERYSRMSSLLVWKAFLFLFNWNFVFYFWKWFFFCSLVSVDVIRNTDPSAQGMFNSGSGSESNPDQLRNTQQKNSGANNPTMSTRGGSRSTRAAASSPYPNACVKITEQPAPKALRFRYECEGRSAGSIPGANSTSDNKTYPSIQVVNYRGRAVVVVSCVTKEQPYRWVSFKHLAMCVRVCVW